MLALSPQTPDQGRGEIVARFADSQRRLGLTDALCFRAMKAGLLTSARSDRLSCRSQAPQPVMDAGLLQSELALSAAEQCMDCR